MKKSQRCQEIFRSKNARLGDQVDVGFDRVGVTMKLLAQVIVRIGNKKKTGPEGYE